MYRLTTLFVSAIFLTSCDDNKEEVFECPTVIEPVIIPAVRVNLFDVNQLPLNVCDAILTVDNPEHAVNHQVANESVEVKKAIREMFAGEFAHAEMACIIENIFEDDDWALNIRVGEYS